jgi:hypothetical protein
MTIQNNYWDKKNELIQVVIDAFGYSTLEPEVLENNEKLKGIEEHYFSKVKNVFSNCDQGTFNLLHNSLIDIIINAEVDLDKYKKDNKEALIPTQIRYCDLLIKLERVAYKQGIDTMDLEKEPFVFGSYDSLVKEK